MSHRVTAQLDAIAQALAAQTAFSSVGLPPARPSPATPDMPLAASELMSERAGLLGAVAAPAANDLASWHAAALLAARLRDRERDAEMFSVSHGGDHDDDTPSVVSFESHASSSGLNDVRKNLGGTWPGPTSNGGGFARAPLDERRAPLNLSALQRSQAHGGKLLDLSDESEDSD